MATPENFYDTNSESEVTLVDKVAAAKNVDHLAARTWLIATGALVFDGLARNGAFYFVDDSNSLKKVRWPAIESEQPELLENNG